MRIYEVGPDGTASLSTVANLLQECAANQSQALWGEGAHTPGLMRQQNLVFALSKIFLKMESQLRWGDVVRITTWFAEEGSLAARRDWTVDCARTGRRLGAATSTWLCFNLGSRRMARLPPTLRSWFDSSSPKPPRRAFAEPPEASSAAALERLTELPADAPCLVSGRVRVRRCDLDMNAHVNNTRYLEWLLDDVPQAVHDAAALVQAQLEYRSECIYGEEVTSRVSLVHPDGSCILPGALQLAAAQGPLAFRHSLVRAADGVELLRARTVWEARAKRGE